MPAPGTTAPWHVVVPVRGTAPSKSRLALPDVDRERLARAFARDTVHASLDARLVERVVVVTAEAARDVFEAMGATVIADPEPPSLAGAIEAGLAVCPIDVPRAVLLGDLPALDGPTLDRTLTAASQVTRGVVPDREGTGTTLLTALGGAPHSPAFGPGSFALHTACGYTSLESDAPARMRADVDTLADLEAAVALGLSPSSASAYERLSTPPQGLRNTPVM